MRRFLFWLCLSALALRLLGIGANLLWYDEAFTAQMLKLPFPQMLQAIRGDVHPPLFYVFDWVALQVGGDNAFALRLPSALFGTLAVAETYQLVKRFGSEKGARWAGVIMALAPAQLYYSQEARMYSLLTVLTIMSARAIMDRNWLRLALGCALIMYTQNIGALYVALLSGWGIIAGGRSALKRLAIVGSSYLPWLVTALGQFNQVGAGYWLPPRASLGAPLYFMNFTTAFIRMPDELYIHGIGLSVALTGIAMIGLWGKVKRFAPLLALAFAPPAVLYIISLLWHPVMLDRALLPAGAGLIAIWGAGLSEISGWGRRALAFLALPIVTVAIITYYTDPTGQRQSSDPIADTIRAGWEPGRDALYHPTIDSAISYSYSLPGYDYYVLPEVGDLSQSLTDTTKDAMGITERYALFSQLRARGYNRAWLFLANNPTTSDYERAQMRYITEHWPTIREYTFADTPISQIRIAVIDLASQQASEYTRVTDQ